MGVASRAVNTSPTDPVGPILFVACVRPLDYGWAGATRPSPIDMPATVVQAPSQGAPSPLSHVPASPVEWSGVTTNQNRVGEVTGAPPLGV